MIYHNSIKKFILFILIYFNFDDSRKKKLLLYIYEIHYIRNLRYFSYNILYLI
jgi:hypothetical protein